MAQEQRITDSRLTKAANQSGTYLFITFFSLAIGVDVALGVFNHASQLALGAFLVTTFATAVLQHNRVVDLDSSPFLLLTLYHLAFAIFVVAIVPFGAAYVFVGLQLVYMSSYAYGKYGALISSLLHGCLLVMSFLLDSSSNHAQYATLVRSLSIFFMLSAVVYYSVHVARREIHDLTQLSHKLGAEQQRLLSLINSMGDAVVSTDSEGRILSYNGAALDILDTNETMTNRPLTDFLSLSNTDGEPVDIIEVTAREGRNLRRRNLLHTYPDGEKINVYVNITPVKTGYGDGSQSGFTLILRDITKEKSLEEERDEFISVVSHELRTPITITEGKISNVMLRNKREVKNRKMAVSLEEAHQQVMFLADMINDLSTLARAERQSLDFEPEKVDPGQLVNDLHAAYEIEAKQKGLELKTKIAKRTPKIMTSPLYLKEILQNFITNSIKYTEKGSVTITVKPAGKKIIFSVQDTGIGVSKSDQKRLFEKFFRSEDYRTRESSGTGLGLYVTAKLAEMIQAKMGVQSTLNKGSTFSITIPRLKSKLRHHSTGNQVEQQ